MICDCGRPIRNPKRHQCYVCASRKSGMAYAVLTPSQAALHEQRILAHQARVQADLARDEALLPAGTRECRACGAPVLPVHTGPRDRKVYCSARCKTLHHTRLMRARRRRAT